MERSFWTDALLVVVTLGFYAPYWLYERNKALRAHHPQLDLEENLWWIVGGLVLTLGGVYVAFADPFWSAAVQVAAVIVFSIGVHVLMRNGEEAADARGLEWGMAPALVSGFFAGAFLLVQAGNVFPSILARGPAIVLLLALPFLFYRVWHDLDDLLLEQPAEPAQPEGGLAG